MKIAFFTDDYLPYVHGVTTSIQNYRQALEELGHEVWIVAPKPHQKDFVDEDDHVVRLPSVNSYIFDKRPVSLLYPGIARRLDEYDFDIVHSQTQFYLFVIAGMVAKRKNIPHMTTVHTLYTELLDDYPTAVTAGLIAVSIGFPFVFKMRPILPFSSVREIRELSLSEKGEIRKKQGWKLISACVNQAHAGIAPSSHLADTLIESGTEIPLHVLPNGISLQRYKQARIADSPLKKAPGEQFIVCVARVSGEKRQEVLVRAMAQVKRKKAKLILVGDGPERENLEQLADELGVADRVVFTGLQPPMRVAAILRQSDVFALASYRFDNQPMVILEALASGLPIVYCDDKLVEGLSDENALLTPGIEPHDFASAFDKLLRSKAKLRTMSQHSRAMAKSFDRTKLAKQLLKYYEQLIYHHPPLEFDQEIVVDQPVEHD
ncbi:glycosyl transferase family 1 [Candidatus Saccharibacteria bacterium]|nr:MAG: glycosyl transferase family 1 [Candidatus Saccharibacteria bacterium]